MATEAEFYLNLSWQVRIGQIDSAKEYKETIHKCQQDNDNKKVKSKATVLNICNSKPAVTGRTLQNLSTYCYAFKQDKKIVRNVTCNKSTRNL